MTKNGSGTVEFPYFQCKNISAPEDDRAGRKVYSGCAPATSVLAVPDNENVRAYLVTAAGKKKKSPTSVHLAIRETLRERTDDFCVLNSGATVVAHRVEINEKTKILTLHNASLVNGSQTQGELEQYFKSFTGQPSIKYELIVTDDDDLIAEISIARNFQNDVHEISIAGRRGQLDDLEKAVQRVFPDIKLRKSESDIVGEDGEFIDSEKLIQVGFACMPTDLLKKLEVGDSKVFTYSQKTRCLKLFTRIVNDPDDSLEELYKYFLDIAGPAWKLYQKWKCHPSFKGTKLRSIQRDGSEIVDVPDGIIFPIIASLSAFVEKRSGKWRIDIPRELSDRELVNVAKQNYMEIADSNPQTMGKSKACYSGMLQLTTIFRRLTAAQQRS